MIKLLITVAIAYMCIILLTQIVIPKMRGRSTWPSWRLRRLRKRLEKANDELDRIAINEKIVELEKQIGKKHHEIYSKEDPKSV